MRLANSAVFTVWLASTSIFEDNLGRYLGTGYFVLFEYISSGISTVHCTLRLRVNALKTPFDCFWNQNLKSQITMLIK